MPKTLKTDPTAAIMLIYGHFCGRSHKSGCGLIFLHAIIFISPFLGNVYPPMQEATKVVEIIRW